MNFKLPIKRVLRHFGYSIQRVSTGRDPFEDMRGLTISDRPAVFDIGANIGQSVENFCKYFKNPEIHSFEPGVEAFLTLTKNTQGLRDVHIVNSGMGARREIKTFVENKPSDLSSFLEPGEDPWGSVIQRYPLQLDTVDDYCDRAGIGHINILKSDTQGYDLEVLRGASKMLKNKRIDLIYLELIFSKMYRNCPRFDEVYAFLADHGMTIVSFYEMHYARGLLCWTDALFANVQNISRLRSVTNSVEVNDGYA